MSKEDKPPFGGFFAFIGAFVGLGYAVQINDAPLIALGGLFVGGWLGYIFEHILFRLIVISLFILMIVTRQAFFGAVFDANAADPIQSPTEQIISAKGDYVTCWKQPCVRVAGSKWSEKNPNGIAVSIRMGTAPAATDDQLKYVLSSDLKHYKIKKFKFFYEQNDAAATVFALHIRGGTEGPFLIGDIREQIQVIAKRVLNTEPVFRDN